MRLAVLIGLALLWAMVCVTCTAAPLLAAPLVPDWLLIPLTLKPVLPPPPPPFVLILLQ
jgi:hypothetical protein